MRAELGECVCSDVRMFGSSGAVEFGSLAGREFRRSGAREPGGQESRKSGVRAFGRWEVRGFGHSGVRACESSVSLAHGGSAVWEFVLFGAWA